ncbi:MAG TPA: sialidase family protein [Frankiaceae bacterium]|nr:sialidase family protein [Frankiaceae bacterium]
MHRSLKLAVCAAALGAAVLPNLPATAATFGTPVVVSPNDVSEPGIEVAPDGTLYVHGPTGVPLRSSIWRSDDAGASWIPTSPFYRTGLGGGDIDITIQPNGKLAFTDLWLGSSSVGVSSDKANSWLTNQVQGTLVQDRQWVANTGRDITYHVTHQLAAGLIVAKSLDGGLTYPVQQVAATTLDQGNCICPPGYLIAEAGTATAGTDDKVGVIYTTATGVKFSRSVNGGLTWAHAVVDPTGGASTIDAFPVVANVGGGKLAAAWLEVSGSTSRVMFSSSLNWGANWSAPRAIVSGGASVFPWIDARNGRIGVSVYHTTSSGNPDNVPNSAQWHLKFLDSTDGGATWGGLTTADPTAVKSGPICTDGINCGADRELGDFQMLAFDNAGKANISYVRSINGANDTEVRFVKES